MSEHHYEIVREDERHQGGVRALLTKAFGPDRMARAIYRLREGVPPDPSLCFVMINQHGQVLGVIRNYRVKAGECEERALLLGPVAVANSHEKMGLAAKLIDHCVGLAREQGYAMIYVVGDPNYYARFGFVQDTDAFVSIENLEPGKIVQGLELSPGAATRIHGVLRNDDSILLDQLHSWG